jgi:hypothetical protein
MTVDNGVRALAGTMALAGVALAHLVHPAFIWVDVFVGANLLQSSVTGFCPAAMLLRRVGLSSRQDSEESSRG